METKKSVRMMETAFDIVYLCIAYLISIILFATSIPAYGLRWQFACFALILAIGDSFHLIPRILSMWSKKDKVYTSLIGQGKQISSLSMTVFYVGLWLIGYSLYDTDAKYLTIIIFVFAVIRVVLCLMPQNKWAADDSPYSWQLLRNIPFIIMCLAVMILFIYGATTTIRGPHFIWLAILISILCYLPVILFAKKNPKVGMLMLPKTCAYIAILIMGFSFPVI